MTVDVKQTCMVGTTVAYDIPDEVAAKGMEAIIDYIQEHYDEIPGGDIEAENAFDWQLDYEDTCQEIEEALKREVA